MRIISSIILYLCVPSSLCTASSDVNSFNDGPGNRTIMFSLEKLVSTHQIRYAIVEWQLRKVLFSVRTFGGHGHAVHSGNLWLSHIVNSWFRQRRRHRNHIYQITYKKINSELWYSQGKRKWIGTDFQYQWTFHIQEHQGGCQNV